MAAQGHSTRTRHARSGDFYLAKNGDSHLATSRDFFMATDKRAAMIRTHLPRSVTTARAGCHGDLSESLSL